MAATTPEDMAVMVPANEVWRSERDYGGMFDGSLIVYLDPAPGQRPAYLAAVKGGWGAGACARRATKSEAMDHAEIMFERYIAT